MAKVEDKNAHFRRTFPAVLFWLLAASIYGGSTYYVLQYGYAWSDEIAYLVKSYWYVTDAVRPYTTTDATGSMPLYFYQLGFWQELVGVGLVAGRALSTALGAVSAVLLFSICRRLTANTTVSAAAVLVFAATPATTYYFATATPAATISTLHLAAIWLIITALGRPRLWATVAMGVICTALFFYSQNMALAIVVIAPLYLLAIGKQRWLHSGVIFITMLGAAAALVMTLPERLLQYALHLPGLAPVLESFGWSAPNFTLINQGTVDTPAMDFAFSNFDLTMLIDGLLLPYAGTILFALLLFRFDQKGLRVLWIVPIYFFWLAAAHFMGSFGQCGACVHSYLPQFAAVGALAVALTLGMMAHWARQNGVPQAALAMFCAIIVVVGNTLAPGLAFSDDFRLFPLSRVSLDRTAIESDRIETLTQWIASHTTADEPMLVIHGIGQSSVPTLPYAAFLAGHTMPVQSLDLASSYKQLKSGLSPMAQDAVQAAIDEESLWSDETMRRWINREYDLILFQEDALVDQSDQLIRITAHFNHIATTTYNGSNIFLFERRPTL